MAARKRKKIKGRDAIFVAGNNVLRGVSGISGVRIYDVGQGDAMCVLDSKKRPVLQIDYGGVQDHPFTYPNAAETQMPLSGIKTLMLSHWDKDHWWTADKNSLAASKKWLVPRQVTSPAAVDYALKVKDIQCIPEAMVGQAIAFTCDNGDQVIFEKIARMPSSGKSCEDCNKTGVAFTVLQAESKQVILLPGDAHFRKVPHYTGLRLAGNRLRGIVAFHHGSGADWINADAAWPSNWTQFANSVDIAFSYGEHNSYDHPDINHYLNLGIPWNVIQTPAVRANYLPHVDILF